MIHRNICHISRSIYPSNISAHKQNILNFRAWLKIWSNIVVIAQSEQKSLVKSSEKNIQGIFLPLKKNRYLNVIFFTICGFNKARKLNRELNFDLFQASDVGGAIMALSLSKFYKKKFLFEVQGDIFDYPGKVGGHFHSFLVKKISRFIAKRADYIRIVSPFLYQPLDKIGIKRDKIFLVAPRCDSNIFNSKNKYDKPHCYETEKKNIVFVGNLLIAKGVDILLDAFSELCLTRNDLRLIFVGDGIEINQLKKIASLRGIAKKVIFEGRKDYLDIPKYIYHADVLVLPSIEEGVGRVLIESMALKTPVIGSKVGGIPYLIEDNKDGLLFDVANIKELKKKISLMIDNKSFAETISENAYMKYKKYYDFDISMETYLEMYKSILKDR